MRQSEASRRPQSQSTADKASSSREVVLAPPPAAPPPKADKSGSIIEFSTISAGEDPNEGVVFGDVPTHGHCLYCDQKVITFLDYEASWVTYLLAFVVWFSLGWMAFWVLPLLWPAFKDVVHRCPRCLNSIHRKSRIHLPTFKTEVMTCKVGSCAVVLSRKYVAILLGLMGLIVSFYFLRSTIQLNTAHEEHKGMPSKLTWDDFIFDCGPKTAAQFSHRQSSAKLFEDRYRKRTFKWQGEVKLIREGFDVFVVKTKSVAMVQMYPPRYRSRRGEHPDIALLFTEDRNQEVAELMPGDWVEFEATMSAHGYRGDPEVMILWHIKKKDRPDPVSSSAGAESDDHNAEELRPEEGNAPGHAERQAANDQPTESAQLPKDSAGATESAAALKERPPIADASGIGAGTDGGEAGNTDTSVRRTE